MGSPWRTVPPPEARIRDVVVLPRTLHHDPRGFLVETLRSDDEVVRGSPFAMSYSSVTVPGAMRDRDRWHVHQLQTDRFVVPLGEMVLALYDPRPGSPTHGRLALLRMAGAPVARPGTEGPPREATTYLVTIPPQVYHCLANLHPTEPFLLQNYPTRLYDAGDEGRVPFAEAPLDALRGETFRWDRVEVDRA